MPFKATAIFEKAPDWSESSICKYKRPKNIDKNMNTNILKEFQDVQRHMNIHMRNVNTQNCLKNPGSEMESTEVLLLEFRAAILDKFAEKSLDPS